MAQAAIAAVGIGVQVAGTAMSYSSQQRMIKEQTAASMRAENTREQQMQLDAQRRRRQAIREAQMARSMGLSVGTAQGATGSSGLSSALSGASAMGVENQQTANSSEALGSRVFSANRDYFRASQRGQAGIALGQGLSSLGGALVSNAGTITRLGEYFGNRPGQTQGYGAP